ncbi:MAG: thioredoxin family protein [Pseudomonadota bacterium]
MIRRTFLGTVAAVAMLPMAALAETIDYTEGAIQAALNEGKTVFVDYAASWCSTCKVQEGRIAALKDENPAYAENITFFRVDWDEFGRAPVSTDRNIPRRSTLIVLKGDQELGRIVAGTGKKQIQKLMDTALAAATS